MNDVETIMQDEIAFIPIGDKMSKLELIKKMQDYVITNSFVDGKFLHSKRANYCPNEKEFTPYRLEQLLDVSDKKSPNFLYFFKYKKNITEKGDIISELNIVFYLALCNENYKWIFWECEKLIIQG